MDYEKTIDIILKDSDKAEVEIQKRAGGSVLYVHVNGVTILRLMSRPDIKVTVPSNGN
jgi:hypothetical protein